MEDKKIVFINVIPPFYELSEPAFTEHTVF